jgi:hypothetical protein
LHHQYFKYFTNFKLITIMSNRILLFSYLLSSILFVSSCKKNDKEETFVPALSIPTTYDSTGFTAATVTEAAVVQNIANLVNETVKGRSSGVVVDSAAMVSFYNGIRSYVIGSHGGKVDTWIAEVVAASRATDTMSFSGTFSVTNAGQGGVVPTAYDGTTATYTGYLLDENGVEHKELIEKWLINTVTYHQVTTLLTKSDLSLNDVHKALVYYGARPTFPNGIAIGGLNDRFLAGYAARRDNSGGNGGCDKGYYSIIKESFLKLQAALKEGATRNRERDEAVAAILLNWEKAQAATIINYIYATITGVQSSESRARARGVHSWNEAVSFLYGARFVPSIVNGKQTRLISDAQIDALLTKLNAPYNDTPKPYLFFGNLTEQAKLSEAITDLKNIYNFSDIQVNTLFKLNDVTERTEGRRVCN